jgi:hypothetical protein
MRLAQTILVPPLMLALSFACHAQAVIGEMFASDASVRGSVLFASGGTQIQSGSSVTAGDAAAVLKLRRGGEVRVCPRTGVSVASSPNGRDLLWSMNSGAIEAHFTLSASSDTVMTPDFRIMLSGPGIFHFAISADARGNICVRALPENTASLIVSELNGDGTYQVKSNVQLVFQNGSVAKASPMVPPNCGCPAPVEPVQRAEEKKPEAKPEPAQETVATAAPSVPTVPHSPDLPTRPVVSETAHLEMEAPFVYEAGDPDKELNYVAARLRLTSGSTLPGATVLAPAAPKPEPEKAAQAVMAEAPKLKEKKGFLGKLGSFFARIFK